jgi:catechol 2,3-dioxygenase-like lactoylglutathione lyase family enzyme
MSTLSVTLGIHQIGLTVPDIGKTRAFFLTTLGFTQCGEMPDYPAVCLTDGTAMVTLWQAEMPASATPFDSRNVIGLHHFSLQVDGVDALEALHDRLKSADEVEVELAPEPVSGGPTMHMTCTIPSGIRIEFVAIHD